MFSYMLRRLLIIVSVVSKILNRLSYFEQEYTYIRYLMESAQIPLHVTYNCTKLVYRILIIFKGLRI